MKTLLVFDPKEENTAFGVKTHLELEGCYVVECTDPHKIAAEVLSEGVGAVVVWGSACNGIHMVNTLKACGGKKIRIVRLVPKADGFNSNLSGGHILSKTVIEGKMGTVAKGIVAFLNK